MAVSSRKSGIGAIKGQKKTNFSQTGKKEARFHGEGGHAALTAAEPLISPFI